VRYRSGPRPFWLHLTCGSRKTYIERLNSAVPDNVSPQSGRGPADDHIIVNGHTLCPQHPALLGTLGGVVLERDAMAMVARVGAHPTGMPLMAVPVRRDDAIAFGSSSGGLWPLTSRRRGAGGVIRLNARRLHPSTVACGWRDRKGRAKGGCYLAAARRGREGKMGVGGRGSGLRSAAVMQPDIPSGFKSRRCWRRWRRSAGKHHRPDDAHSYGR
jgi:hypothetical protein